MKTALSIVLLFIFAAGLPAQNLKARRAAGPVPRAPAAPASNAGSFLPIKRVILYSNGVAYIERRGIVSGDARIDLSFKQSQVDDVLKSLVVLDLGQGRIGAVSYNSSAPPSAKMAEIPFGVNSDTQEGGGLAGVLKQLQGARVLVATAKGPVVGSVLTVEKRRVKTDKLEMSAYALVLASETGELSSFDLSEVRSVKLLEEGTRRDVSEFTDAAASARRRDAKTITVTSEGAGEREMVVSYTVAAPIWKTTYRVVLDSEGKPFFQGWAIVDNVSDEDWNNVKLSLVSGTPISFIQPIQKPFYRYRPLIPIPQDLKISPQVYETMTSDGGSRSGNLISGVVTDANGAVIPNVSISIENNVTRRVTTAETNDEGVFYSPAIPPGSYTVSFSQQGFQTMRVRDVAVNTGSPRNLNITMEVAGVSATVEISASQLSSLPSSNASVSNYIGRSSGSGSGNGSGDEDDEGEEGTTTSELLSSQTSGVRTAASGEEFGDLFEYRIDQPVTVSHDRSALIPIVQTKMEGERISIYNESVRADRPLSGMLLKNTTPLTFETGSMTVLDRDAYAGEALMERLKPKEERLISFALDLGTSVSVEEEDDRAPAKLIKAVDGVLQIHYFKTQKKNYHLVNQSDREKIVYIEHPVDASWELSDETVKPTITTAKYYRFRVVLKPFDKVDLPVIERQGMMDSYQIRSIGKDELALFVQKKYLDEKARASLERFIELRSRIAVIGAQLHSYDDEERKIAEDQKRLRDNIEALAKTPEAKTLIERYIAKANEQETRMEEIAKERKALAQQKQQLDDELAAEIRRFSL